MTNSTNWPDPNRPGVPMFPEREMRHALKKKDTGEVIIRNWKSDGQYWDMIGRSASWCSDMYFYEGTFITPTKIAEMLAAERERCAALCDGIEDEEWRKWKTRADMMAQGASNGAMDCATAIRALPDEEGKKS